MTLASTSRSHLAASAYLDGMGKLRELAVRYQLSVSAVSQAATRLRRQRRVWPEDELAW